MPHHLIRKLGRYVHLPPEDEAVLARLVHEAAWIGPGRDLLQEGAAAKAVWAVLEGWACLYKQLEDGRRHITAYLLPGDLCGAPIDCPSPVNYAIGTLTPVRAARIPGPILLAAMESHPSIRRAVWLDMLATSAIQREWTANIGFRTARERIAHLFCEIVSRLQAVGLADETGCLLPLTQEDLGETVGISTVHVNRTLQELRQAGLITLRRQRLGIPDVAALRKVACFDDVYLRPLSSGSDRDRGTVRRSEAEPVVGSEAATQNIIA
ncbi:Crp/Fnr family transcriptional regulator [Methylobacterium aquaticum]|uniref:Crp/Fnr family transcriptional regulator n=1 Tax=Methylobacterium aquaticum TaxID=270351 RepID=UPI0019334173|nr:Crp/Fnr family transcriptional regulator [Methylobacterium aquaticum]QRE72967.1 Crp/Fnr family transcriptional regulator [Methylobacterium aquaticum]